MAEALINLCRQAEQYGAIPLAEDELKETLYKETDGRGPDVILEVVGQPAALNLALDLVRPYGIISSCGVHTKDVTLNGRLLYGKNIRLRNLGFCTHDR